MRFMRIGIKRSDETQFFGATAASRAAYAGSQRMQPEFYPDSFVPFAMLPRSPYTQVMHHLEIPMNADTPLADLRSRLSRLGYSVHEVGSGFAVRLPLICSVRIFPRGDALVFEPRFGRVRRSTATWWMFFLTMLLWTVTLAYLFVTSRLGIPIVEHRVLLLIFGLVAAMFSYVWDVYRYLLTESFVTRAQSLADSCLSLHNPPLQRDAASTAPLS